MAAESHSRTATEADTDKCVLHRLHELADEASNQKAGQLRHRLANDKLQVTCRLDINSIIQHLYT